MNISKILILVLLSTFVLNAGLGTATLPGYMDKLVSITDQQTTPIVWNASNFDGFNYNSSDLPSTETLTIAPFTLYGTNIDRIIEIGNLTYITTFILNEYPIFTDLGLYVNDNENGYRTGYLNGKQYVAITDVPDKLATPLVEFNGNDVKTLRKGDVWDIGGNFSITALEIDVDGNKVLIELDKDGVFLDDAILETRWDLQCRVWTYNEDVAGKFDIPILSLYVSGIMQGEDTDYVQIKYLSLIDNNVSEISTGYQFDNMKVTCIAENSLELSNLGDLNLTSDNSPFLIMDNMSFIILNNSSSIEFYPSVDGNETSTLYDASGFISGNYSSQWNLSENYTIALQEVGIKGEKAMFVLLEDGVIVDQKIMTERLIALNILDSNYQYIKNETQIINATLDFVFYGFNSEIANLIDVYQWSEVNSSFMFSNESHIFESTTSIGTPWNLSEEYTLTMKDVSLDADEVWFQLSLNDDVVVEYDILNEDVLNESVYASGNGNISYVLDSIFGGINERVVKIRNVDQYSDINGAHLINNTTHFYKTGNPSGIPWDLSEGYTLTMKDVDLDADKVWFQLSLNNDVVVEYDILSEDILNESVYTSENGNISYVLDSIFDGINERVVKIRNVDQYSDINGAHLINNTTHFYKTGNPVGIPWAISENYTLTMKDFDPYADEVWFELFKDGESLKEDFVNSNALFSHVNDSESFNFSVSWIMDGTLADVVKVVDVNLYSDVDEELLHNGSNVYATSNPSGEIWQLSEGYSLDPKDADVYGHKVWLSLSKDDTVVMNEMIDLWNGNADRWFNYSNSSGELVFSTYVGNISGMVDYSVVLKNSTQYSEINGTPLFSDSEKTLRTGMTLNNSVNRAPVLGSIGPKTVDENSTLSFTLTASDADSDSVTYSAVDLPSGASLNASSGLFNWTPTYDQAGTYSVVFNVTDGALNDSETVTITVDNVNRAPIILTTIGDITVIELDTASIQVFASDPDGDSLTISNNINMPVTATFNESTNTFTWNTTYDTVKYTNSKTFTGMITVTDSGGLFDNQTVNITVNNKNRAPTLLPLSNVTITEGETFTLSPVADDPDKDELTFVYLDIPVDFVGGDGTWKVNTSGDYTIDVSVVDSGGLYANQSVTINVTGLPPKLFVVNPVNNTEINSTNLKVSGSAYDKNLETLTLLINGTLSIDLTDNVSDIANGGGWFEQNITLYDGINTLEFNASDASSSTVINRTVVVNTSKVNSAPVLTITSPLNNSEIISESNVTAVSGHVTDDSGIPNVLVSIDGVDKVVGVSKDGYFGTNVNLSLNTNIITVTVTDAGGLIDTETLVVNYTKLIPVDTVDPILILTYPPMGLEVGSEKLLVTGYATDNVGIKNVTVNGSQVALFNCVFSTEVTLSAGNNTITVVATDTSDNNVTRTRTVAYNEPDPKAGLIKVEKISLSVSQNSLYADSGNVSNVTAFATDIAGRPANDSEVVKFVKVTNNGVTQSVVQLENGTAVLSVTATEEPQTIIVIASNDTMVLASTQIVVKPNVKIEKIMDNVSITVGGRTAGKSHVVLLDNGVVNIQADPDIISELVDASEDGKVIFTVDVGTGSNLEIKMKNAMLINGGNLTGEVIGIVLINRPIKTDFTELNGSVGEVTFDVNVELNGTTLPGTITFVMSGHKSIDDVVSSIGGEDAGGVCADKIKENIAKKLKDVYKKNANNTHVDSGIAAVIHAKMDGASNDDVNEVPISITLSLDWFNNVAGGDADNVKVFEINETTGEIEAVLDCVVVDNGDGTVTISAIASGFSSYAFTSTTTAPDIESSNDDVPSSSGGSGGGGGTSGEAFENIKVKDVIREYIVIDSVVKYKFKEEVNAIDFVTFDAKTNAGYISATVEVLNHTSALVSSAPSGEVYQNMNIWVGKAGYATETNIANPVIGFKVAKSWIIENNIDESTIKLNRYSSGAWNKLPTTKTDEDISYIYFSSETPGFSPFAITGDEGSSSAFSNVPDSSLTTSSTAFTVDDDVNEAVSETASIPDDEENSSGGFALVVGLIGISVLGVGLYFKKDEIGKWINQRR